jgi:hypothetical protein
MDMEKKHQRQELFKKCVKQLVEASVRLGGGRIIQRKCVRVDLVKGCVYCMMEPVTKRVKRSWRLARECGGSVSHATPLSLFEPCEYVLEVSAEPRWSRGVSSVRCSRSEAGGREWRR